MHGYKDQTRLDSRVRDSWEIAGHRLRFATPRWPAALERAVLRVSRGLGLAPSSQLRVEPHNLAQINGLEAAGGAVPGPVRASLAAGAPKLGQQVFSMLLRDGLRLPLSRCVLRRARQTVKAAANLGLAAVPDCGVHVCDAYPARPVRSAAVAQENAVTAGSGVGAVRYPLREVRPAPPVWR